MRGRHAAGCRSPSLSALCVLPFVAGDEREEAEEMDRDVTGLVVPTLGSVASIGAAPGTVLLDATGEPVEEVSEFFATMLACGASVSSLRSYGLALLRWWRFLAAIDVPWQRAGRVEARDFVLWMRLVGPAGRQAGYAPATINHALAVVKMFYADRINAGDGPLINPVPNADHRAGRRSQAHHNPMQPFAPGPRAPLRQKMPERIPRHLPDRLFDELFATLRSDRDRALLAFYVSTGARASELLGVTVDRVNAGDQRIGVHRKGVGPAAVAARLGGRVRVASALRAADTSPGRRAGVVADSAPSGEPAHLLRGQADAAARERVPGHRLDLARPATHRGPADGRRPEHVVDRRAVGTRARAYHHHPDLPASAGGNRPSAGPSP
jgi:integrase